MIVILQDRYSGAYSGGQWLACETECMDMVPWGPWGGDVECMLFWQQDPRRTMFGVSDTAYGALAALAEEVTRCGEYWDYIDKYYLSGPKEEPEGFIGPMDEMSSVTLKYFVPVTTDTIFTKNPLFERTLRG